MNLFSLVLLVVSSLLLVCCGKANKAGRFGPSWNEHREHYGGHPLPAQCFLNNWYSADAREEWLPSNSKGPGHNRWGGKTVEISPAGVTKETDTFYGPLFLDSADGRKESTLRITAHLDPIGKREVTFSARIWSADHQMGGEISFDDSLQLLTKWGLSYQTNIETSQTAKGHTTSK